MALHAMLLIFLLLLASDTATAHEQLLFVPFCQVAYWNFPACLSYLLNVSDDVEPECCDGINKLNQVAKQDKLNPQKLCYCIEFMERSSQLDASRISALPTMCKTHLSFPISNSMDCSQ
ncbi:hypothetical protein SLA2020_461300 [Shorea laevis]